MSTARVRESEKIIREYVRASEAVLELQDLSDDEEAVVSEMLLRLSDKLYPD